MMLPLVAHCNSPVPAKMLFCFLQDPVHVPPLFFHRKFTLTLFAVDRDFSRLACFLCLFSRPIFSLLFRSPPRPLCSWIKASALGLMFCS